MHTVFTPGALAFVFTKFGHFMRLNIDALGAGDGTGHQDPGTLVAQQLRG